MYSLTATKVIQDWLIKELKPQSIDPAMYGNNINRVYKHPKFIIKEYTGGVLTIDGEYQKRIYEKIINISKEEDKLGCDEVGVGDFFGPVVYCAVFFDLKTIKKISQSYLPIKDSKKLKDSEVKVIYQSLKNNVNYSVQIMYDWQIADLNSIGQKVYNHYQNVKKYQPKETIIDLFTTEKSFYKYSQDLSIVWPKELRLETKADGKFLSVALASIFARAIFLEEMDKLEVKYQMKFPLGAGQVKGVAREFIDKYSKAELAKFAKTSFKTFNEL